MILIEKLREKQRKRKLILERINRDLQETRSRRGTPDPESEQESEQESDSGRQATEPQSQKKSSKPSKYGHENKLIEMLIGSGFPLDLRKLHSKLPVIPKYEDVRKMVSSLETKNLCHTEKIDGSTNIVSANRPDLEQILRKRGVKHKIQRYDKENDPEAKKSKKDMPVDLDKLLSRETAREREAKRAKEEIKELLSRESVKEKMLATQFKSKGVSAISEYCPLGTHEDCWELTKKPCYKLHFTRLLHQHTEASLGDCSFLDTCFHMETCKYIHYDIHTGDLRRIQTERQDKLEKSYQEIKDQLSSEFRLMPPQWVQCDMRSFDMTVLGKFAVIMADPPWDIHMELPYGTMSDDEMRTMKVPCLQDDGFIFLWVTGRAMELGRECLSFWGYRRCDELIWVKTNQLQKLIRTGRTGHWINHGKEHCLIGVKGNPPNVNLGLDCDVIVGQVRATSHKPDEVYGLIERLSPGTRKIELFGRPHNTQPNWITLGNQLDGIQIHEEDVKRNFRKRYPDGKCV